MIAEMRNLVCLILLFNTACMSSDEASYRESRRRNRTFAPVQRESHDKEYFFEEVERVDRAPYPWEKVAEKEPSSL